MVCHSYNLFMWYLTHENSLYYSMVAGLVSGMLIFNE